MLLSLKPSFSTSAPHTVICCAVARHGDWIEDDRLQNHKAEFFRWRQASYWYYGARQLQQPSTNA